MDRTKRIVETFGLKGLIKIKTGFLIKPFGDKARFIAFHGFFLALLEKPSPLHSLLEKEEPRTRSDFEVVHQTLPSWLHAILLIVLLVYNM